MARWTPLWLEIALLVGAAGTLPVAINGYLSLRALRAAAGAEVRAKHVSAAKEAADLIGRHVRKYREMMGALTGTLEVTTHLRPEQVERVLKNYEGDVHDFRELDLVAPDGHEIATGRADGVTRDRSGDESVRGALANHEYFGKVKMGPNVEPEIEMAVPIRTAGRVESALVARVDLTEMWALVEDLAPEGGVAKVIDADGRLIAASGDRDKEAVLFNFAAEKVAARPVAIDSEPQSQLYDDAQLGRILRAGAPIESTTLRWRAVLEQPYELAFAAVADQERRLAFTVVICLLLTALLGGLGARLVTRPLRALTVRTREIARGELAGRVEPAGAREVGALGDSINRMSEDLLRLTDEMKTRERISSFARFGAGVVHDLKTPINALQMNAMLAVHSTDDAERSAAIGRLMDEQKVIERHLMLLRSYARGEPIELRPVLVDAGAFVEKAAARARARWSHVEVKTVAPPPASRAYFFGDPGFLERVIENLAKNAVEAMAGRDKRELELRAEAGPVEDNGHRKTFVYIRDSGKGMPPEALDRLFEPFRSSKATGMGIGLAMSQWIVKESGGDISCESRLEEGTIFRIALPAQPPGV